MVHDLGRGRTLAQHCRNNNDQCTGGDPETARHHRTHRDLLSHAGDSLIGSG